MSGAKKDDPDRKLAPNEAEELAKDAAEGLRQIPSPGASIPSDATTIPGIPIDALRLETNEPTVKIERRRAPDDDEGQTSEADPASPEEAEAETIPPTGEVTNPLDDDKRPPPDATTVAGRKGVGEADPAGEGEGDASDGE